MFTCPHEHRELVTSLYIGLIRITIDKRLEQHFKDGTIKEHLRIKHQQNSTLEILNKIDALLNNQEMHAVRLF